MPTLALPTHLDPRPPEARDRDEVWYGVQMMAPAPHVAHEAFDGSLYVFLTLYWARPGGHRVFGKSTWPRRASRTGGRTTASRT